MSSSASHVPSAWIAIDGGSTNTRVWLMHQNRVTAHAFTEVGARDTARAGSPEKLRLALRELIAEVRKAHPRLKPSLVAAAGMITSPLGLAEVPHVPAPAGAETLARGARRMSFADITDAPVWLFPGVRCGDFSSTEISLVDVMRGEETLCVGLLADKRFRPPFTVLNLGSHWKLIQVDKAGRIVFSRTSLAGELIHVTQTSTILASGLAGGKPESLDVSWCERGMMEMRGSGLPRALFCVRLLEMQGRTTPKQRMSFLLGAYVSAELDPLLQAGHLAATISVVIAASGAVADAWGMALKQARISTKRLTESKIESAFLAGLCVLVQKAIHLRRS